MYKWKHGRNLYGSCAQDYSRAIQRLSLEKKKRRNVRKGTLKVRSVQTMPRIDAAAVDAAAVEAEDTTDSRALCDL